MKLFILLLLVATCASSGFLDNFGEKMKGVLGKIKTALNTTTLYKIHEKFRNFKETLKQKLTLSPERKALLQQLLKKIINIKKDHVQEKGDSIDEINKKVPFGQLLFQSDILLTSEQADEIIKEMTEDEGNRTKRQAFRDRRYPQTIWSKGVNYYFHPSASADVQRVFKKGAYLWEKDTCIDFRMNRAAPDRIRVFSEDGCWSFVGRLNREQDLSLGEGCEAVDIAAHEIGHALGFFHTMSRYDRDNFITFNPRNVEPDWLDQFTKETEATNENYGITYDYGSIMHYGASRCETARSANCEMGGFPHPRNCSKCICPSGYGGELCNERPSGCGQVFEAKRSYQAFIDEVGDRMAGQKPREDMSVCNYWIKAPVGSRVEVIIADMSRGATVDGCKYWGVEIKTHADQRMTGYRFCAAEDIGMKLVSHYHIVPIITYNRFYATRVKILYRIVP